MSAFLPGAERADLAVELERLGAVDGRPFQRLAGAHRDRLQRRVAAQRVVAHLLAAGEQQRRLHLAEHLARGVELDVDADRRQAARLAERRHHGVADVVVQLDQHGRGQARAGVDHHAEIGGVVARAVHEVVVGPEQARAWPSAHSRPARRNPRAGACATTRRGRTRAPCGCRARPPPRRPSRGRGSPWRA